MLNLIFEKIDQKVFYDSLKTAIDQWIGVELTNYAVAESTLVDKATKGMLVCSQYYNIIA